MKIEDLPNISPEEGAEITISSRPKRTRCIHSYNGPDCLWEYPNVTRVEVIDNKGRVYIQHNLKDVQVALQDDGRTLKIFVQEK